MCEWHSTSGIYSGWGARELPLCGGLQRPWPQPVPLPCEGGSWAQGSAGVENEPIECRGVFPLSSSGMVSRVGGFVSVANPTSYVQEWLSHWPGEVAISHRECDLVPQIHSLDAKDHGDEGVLFQNKTKKSQPQQEQRN